MMYFLITVSKDGDVSVKAYQPHEVIQAIDDHGLTLDELWGAAPDKSYPQYWGDRRGLLIKGEVVVPRAVEVVTRYELP